MTETLLNETSQPQSDQQQQSSQFLYSDFEGLLRIYYERLFPFKKFHRWLSIGSQFPFPNREFSFTLANDIYLRFQSFQDSDEFESKVCKLVPYKIDIGACYNARPADRKTIHPNAFRPLEKELVFDIDMTDYDDVRKCCKDKKICCKCWKFVAIAAKILDSALEEDFGFRHRMWVFSGRRGIHCWVCDEGAKQLGQNARKAILSYLEVIRGGDELRKKVHFNGPLHPFIQRAKGLIEECFEDVILLEQQLLYDTKDSEKILFMIPDEQLRQQIRNRWAQIEQTAGSIDDDDDIGQLCIKKWDILVKEVNSFELGKRMKYSLKNTVTEIMFQLLFPRLDTNVSTQLNHLLKSPFCAHPDTWKICVPIPIDSVFRFDPLTVPTLQLLVREIDQFEEKGVNDILKTSLKLHYDNFCKFIVKMETSQSKNRIYNNKNNDNKMEF